MSDTKLLVGYRDNENTPQGPFDAEIVLHWFKIGYFNDYHLFRITDNGMSIGYNITWEGTLRELKAIFGDEEPIPLTIGQFDAKRVSKHCLKTTAERLKIARQTLKEAAEDRRFIEDCQRKQRLGLLNSNDYALPESSTTDSLESSKSSVSHIRANENGHKKRHDSTDVTTAPSFGICMKLPTPLRDTSSVLKAGFLEHRFPRATCSPESRDEKTRTASVSSTVSSFSTSSSAKKSKKSKKPKTKNQDQLAHRPFHDGSICETSHPLSKLVALELTSYLTQKMGRLTKPARESLHTQCSRAFAIPAVCKVCQSSLSAPANYLSHVLSQNHIRKSIEESALVFTFEEDYKLLQKMFDEAEKLMPPSQKSSEPKKHKKFCHRDLRCEHQ